MQRIVLYVILFILMAVVEIKKHIQVCNPFVLFSDKVIHQAEQVKLCPMVRSIMIEFNRDQNSESKVSESQAME